MSRPNSAAAASGVSLVELITVVAVTGALAAGGVPAMRAWFRASELTATANSLLYHVHFARSEAILRNVPVVLCKSADGASCSTAGRWDQGFIVFHDRNSNGRPDALEPIVRREPAFDAYVITGNATVRDAVTYAPDGFSRLPGGGFQAGTLTICQRMGGAAEGRELVINAAGRPRVQRAAACQ